MKGPRLRTLLSGLLHMGLLALMVPSPALSCSICRCGDPAFNALGTDIYSPGAFRLAVDWDRFDKTQGPPDESESQIQNSVTFTASYSFGDRVNLVARVPYSFKSLTMTADGMSDVTDTHGLSDPEFFAWIRLWASDLYPGLGRRSWFSVQVGVKTPWGQDDLTGPDGERLDQHAQPGTGSTDADLEASISSTPGPRSTVPCSTVGPERTSTAISMAGSSSPTSVTNGS